MDPRLTPLFHQLQHVQTEVRDMQFVQATHSERLIKLERRQADDAAIKSVWNSPFPSVLGGTPQHGPVQMSTNEVFDDFDAQSQNLLGSLHLEADDEPIRRGAASRANSVRFDESTLQGSNWGQSTRHSVEFGPVRPGSGLGSHNMMERSLSHRSDGRHSSTGHSVHSLHSVASGRASSLGLENNFLLPDQEDASPVDIPQPPPGFFILGSVPSIVRCWLTTNYAHDTLLYADVCTGSQKSTLDYSLVKELGLVDELHRDLSGVLRINLSVYFAEATLVQSHSRSSSPSRQVPYITAKFEVVGMDQADVPEGKKGIRVFIGSDTLRANSADLLLSQNLMMIYGNGEDREKLSVPFVRPEDDSVYKNILTTNVPSEKIKLNATAPEFVSEDTKASNAIPLEKAESAVSHVRTDDLDSPGPLSPLTNVPLQATKNFAPSIPSESGGESDRPLKEGPGSDNGVKESTAGTEERRREAAGGIWASWRHGTSASGSESGQRETGLSGYQPAGRGNRSMKVLKPQKAGSSSSARTGASYEPPIPSRSSGEHRRKSQGGAAPSETNGTIGGPTALRWEAKRTASNSIGGMASAANAGGPGIESRSRSSADLKSLPATSRVSNPVGGASAFSWMNPANKPKTPATAAD